MRLAKRCQHKKMSENRLGKAVQHVGVKHKSKALTMPLAKRCDKFCDEFLGVLKKVLK